MFEYFLIALVAWAAFHFLVLRPRTRRKELGGVLDPVEASTRIKEHFDETAHPRDLLQYRPFTDAALGLSRSPRSDAELLTYANGVNPVVACMALEALALREDDEVPTQDLLDCLNVQSWWARFFALRALDLRHQEPIAARALTSMDQGWAQPLMRGFLDDFLDSRRRLDDTPSVEPFLESLSATQFKALEAIVEESKSGVLEPVRDVVTGAARERVDTDLLSGIGLIASPGDAVHHLDVPSELTSGQKVAVETAMRTLAGRRSVVVTGEVGVGKSATVAQVATRLLAEGWYVWWASANDLLAGQSYIGQLEERLKNVIQGIGRRKVVWVVPEMVELIWAGRHNQRPTGVMDMLLPELAAGQLVLLGETRASSLDTLHREQPQMRSLLHTVRVAPATEQESKAIAGRWARETTGADTLLTDELLQEAFLLSQQYLGDRALPGSLMHLLKAAHGYVEAAGTGRPALTADDFITALSGLTGLPATILDDRAELSIEAVRAHFGERVLGQPEAVDCLVERIAMIKAGVTDPGRPQGVFLFVGPTGTGKTEIAKALASYLFGSPERMIRLDMSEFQAIDSLDRLLGSTQPGVSGSSLVYRIRHEPFSLVLLDEVEKAHPNVWDVFLQIFDDGRLTDRQGKTADFRHALIILTSNLGAAVQSSRGVGFGAPTRSWSTAAIQKSLEETFRPEFLNRIDRVVPFRPLGRDVMRGLLDKELRELLQRRGLRNREWAVEWEASAIELLLEKGFSPQYGARPLRRAVEQYLLTPLAMAIVERSFPEGDAFLFIRRRGDTIDVEWVDPDEPDEAEDLEAQEEPAGELVLEALALGGTGSRSEVDALQAEYEHLESVIRGREWEAQKDAALAAMSDPGFWDREDRFATLGQVEYRDRVEVGFETAGSLLRRLVQGRSRRFPSDLVRRLAQRLYLVGVAVEDLAEGSGGEAFLRVAARHDPGADPEATDAFAKRVASMYRTWAEKRGMRWMEPDGSSAMSPRPFVCTAAVSGFGAYSVLALEAGLHVYEMPGDSRSFRRVTALVTVVPQPVEPSTTEPDGIWSQAERALGDGGSAGEPTVVRRYREEPSPLVRDAVRQWRTGRADAVFDGDFDLIC